METETLSAVTRHRWRAPVTNVQLRLHPKQYKEMRAVARANGLAFSSWLRQVALAELRRARKRSL
jgi:hypothetical protein